MLERTGKGQEAVQIYIWAVRNGGSAKAAKRLGEIYKRGIEGVPADQQESVKWYRAARVLGE